MKIFINTFENTDLQDMVNDMEDFCNREGINVISTSIASSEEETADASTSYLYTGQVTYQSQKKQNN